MEWISLKDEKPLQMEVVLAANPFTMAVCTAFYHTEECAHDCSFDIGYLEFYSVEDSNKVLIGVTHFMRIRNPNEVLQ